MKPSVWNALSEGVSLTWNRFGRFAVPSLILFASMVAYMGLTFGTLVALEYAPLVGYVLQMVTLLFEGVSLFVSAAIFIWLVVRAFQLIRSSDYPVFTWGRFGWHVLYYLLVGAVSFALLMLTFVVSLIGGFGIGAFAASGSYAGAIVLMVIGALFSLATVIALIYVGVRFMLVPYVIADTSANPIEALKRSWQLSSGRFWPLLGISILWWVFYLVGLIVLGIGTIFTIPASYAMIAHYYDQLSRKPVKKA